MELPQLYCWSSSSHSFCIVVGDGVREPTSPKDCSRWRVHTLTRRASLLVTKGWRDLMWELLRSCKIENLKRWLRINRGHLLYHWPVNRALEVSEQVVITMSFRERHINS